jgi:hypothetical protein
MGPALAFERVPLHHDFEFYCIALHRGALVGEGMGSRHGNSIAAFLGVLGLVLV